MPGNMQTSPCALRTIERSEQLIPCTFNSFRESLAVSRIAYDLLGGAFAAFLDGRRWAQET